MPYTIVGGKPRRDTMTSDEDREESRKLLQSLLDIADKDPDSTPEERQTLRAVVESADPLRELQRITDEIDNETAAIRQENERIRAEAKRRADEAAAEL